MDKLTKIIEKKEKPMYREDLIGLFRKLEIKSGDIVIMHVSLSSLGYLVGGEQSLIQTLLEYLGADGTLVMPSQTVNISNPNMWEYPPVPENWQDAVRDSIYPYEVDKTPVDDMLGVVARYFSTYKNTKRSNHPLYSFCANGKMADTIISRHDYDYGFGMESPLGKMYELDAKVLMIGTDFDSNTSIHLAENFLDRDTIIESAPVLVDGEKKWIEFKNVDLDIYDDFPEIEKEFKKEYSNSIHIEEIFNGEAMYFSMRDCVDFSKKYYFKKEKNILI
mgnify:CR=1 FL=1